MSLLKSHLLRRLLVVGIIVVTFGVFIFYGASHPEVINTILSLNPMIIVLLTIAYSFTVLSNGLILHFSLSYLRSRTPVLDNIILTGYSSVVNFFGPLQSGPGFRAIYLKKKHGIEIKQFILVTFIFYLFFAVINLLIVGLAGFIQEPDWRIYITLIILTLLLFAYLIVKFKSRVQRIDTLISAMRIKDRNFWLIGLGALLLTFSSGFVYLVELTEIVPDSVNLWQVMVYTATANLSLFVSLTPGAIGFREGFLLVSQQLHDIPTASIIAASLVDRAFYVVYLLVMFVILLVVNTRKKLLPIITGLNWRR